MLGGLLALDVGLAVWGFLFPEAWFRFFHGADYLDPQGLLPRCAANWLAFAIVQACVLLRWRRSPGWRSSLRECGSAMFSPT
jgi:hypothetical protein